MPPNGRVSIRDLCDELDPVHETERIGGNGPPFAATRPNVDPETLATYRGTPYVPQAAATAASTAYDLGMVNRSSEGVAEPLESKGLLEAHRWHTPEQGDAPGAAPGQSMRAVARRHTEGTRHTLVFYNTKLSAVYQHNAGRAKAIGEVLARMGGDIIGFCEVQEPFVGDPDNLRAGYEEHYSGDVANSRHSTGALYSLVGTDRPEGTIRTADVTAKKYDNTTHVVPGPGNNWHHSPPRGWQRLDVGLEVPGVQNAGIEIFVTHLRPYNQESDVSERHAQVREMARLVNRRREERPSWPKIVVGDLNVHSNRENYDFLLNTFAGANLQDAWLTHGGPAGHTHDPGQCRLTSRSGVGTEQFAPHVCDDFVTDHYGGSRLDYIFVEQPRPEHAISLDLSRIWRCPMSENNSPIADVVDGSYFHPDWGGLSDHLAVGCDLLTSQNMT